MEQQHPSNPHPRQPLTNLRDPNQLQPNFDLLSSLFVPPCVPTATVTPLSGTPIPRVRKHRRLRKLQCSSDDDDNAPDCCDTAQPTAAHAAPPPPPGPDVIVLDDAWLPTQPTVPSSHAAIPSTQVAEVVDLTACPSPHEAPTTQQNPRPARAHPFAAVSSRPQQVATLLCGTL